VTREQLIVLGFIAAAFVAGWLTSALVGMVARRRDPDPAEPASEPALPELGPQMNGRQPIAEEVGDALRNDAANDSMLSVLRADRDPALSELELDLADWGFTYGVAWARVRERRDADGDDAVAGEALDAARRVFHAYTDGADWKQRIEKRLAEPPVPGDGPGSGQTAHSPSPRSTL
jgi:hypothetical protein